MAQVDRTIRNEHVTALAKRIVEILSRELAGTMFNNADRCAVLLAAAHGEACAAGMSEDALDSLAAQVFEAAARGRERKTESVDHTVEQLERKVFES